MFQSLRVYIFFYELNFKIKDKERLRVQIKFFRLVLEIQMHQQFTLFQMTGYVLFFLDKKKSVGASM